MKLTKNCRTGLIDYHRNKFDHTRMHLRRRRAYSVHVYKTGHRRNMTDHALLIASRLIFINITVSRRLVALRLKYE